MKNCQNIGVYKCFGKNNWIFKFLGGLFTTVFRTKIANKLEKLIRDTVTSYQNHFGISQGLVDAKHTIKMHDFELLRILFHYLDLF